MTCTLCEGPALFWYEAPDRKKYFRCGNCSLVFLEPGSHPDAERELARYREHNNLLNSPSYLSYLDRLAAPVTAALAPGKKRGFDYGCGPVEGMRHLLEPRGFSISSYDPYFFSREELLKFSYDFVLCSEVVEHFFRPCQDFLRLQSCLGSGSILGISSRLYPESSEEFAHWGYRRDPTHVSFFSAETVHWLAQKFGWELLNLESPIWIFRKR